MNVQDGQSSSQTDRAEPGDCQMLQPHRPRHPQWAYKFYQLPDGIPPNSLDDAVMPSVLCDSCEKVRSLIQKTMSTFLDESDDKKTFLLHDMCDGLRKGFERGCHLCDLIWRAFTEPDQGVGQTPANGEVYVTFGVSLFHSKYFLEPFIRVRDENGDGTCDRVYGDKLPILKSAILPPPLGNASCCLYTNSTPTWTLAKLWMKECIEGHRMCSHRKSASFLPTRLIDVGDGANLLRIIETAFERPQNGYITLSYCWGGVSDVRLTESTIHGWKTKLPWTRLPKTIQHAVIATRELGFRYLWVDSLCIIQDSKADWDKEAPSMADVYKNCILTISALGACNSNEGLFAERDPLAYIPCWIFNNSKGEKFLCNTHRREKTFLKSRFHNTRLHRRGWVMQERLLSPRTLNFGSAVVWECRESVTNDCGIGHPPFSIDSCYLGFSGWLKDLTSTLRTSNLRSVGGSLDMILDSWNSSVVCWAKDLISILTASNSRSVGETLYMILHITSCLFPLNSREIQRFTLKGWFHDMTSTLTNLNGMLPREKVDALLKIWVDDIVGDYTDMSLSYPADKLIAFSGIIAAVREKTGWKNICGLWEPLMLNQLLWETDGSKPRIQNGAPTWSWASVETTVHYYDWDRLHKSIATIEGQEEISLTTTADFRGENMVGLRINSILFQLERHGKFIKVLGSPPAEEDSFALQDDVSPTQPGPYLFIPIFCSADPHPRGHCGHNSYLFGIAITRSPTIPEAYERVGYVRLALLEGHLIDEVRGERGNVLIV